jgi:hypothetical protein
MPSHTPEPEFEQARCVLALYPELTRLTRTCRGEIESTLGPLFEKRPDLKKAFESAPARRAIDEQY